MINGINEGKMEKVASNLYTASNILSAVTPTASNMAAYAPSEFSYYSYVKGLSKQIDEIAKQAKLANSWTIDRLTNAIIAELRNYNTMTNMNPRDEARLMKLLTKYGLTENSTPSEVREAVKNNCKDEVVIINGMPYIITENAAGLQEYVFDNNFYQEKAGEREGTDHWDGACLGFSILYADAIRRADNAYLTDYLSDPNREDWYNGPETQYYTYDSHYKIDSKEQTLAIIFSELEKGNPVVVQVSGLTKRDENGHITEIHRHYVVAVGYKESANPGNYKETDLLILDDYDGELCSIKEENGEAVIASGSRIMIRGVDTADFKNGNGAYDYGYEIFTAEPINVDDFK